MDYGRIPARKVSGPVDVYYYNYVADRASGDDMRIVQPIGGRPKGGIILYEILNLVDGKRSIQAIRDYLAAAYGPIAVEDVSDYLRLLEKTGVVKIEG